MEASPSGELEIPQCFQARIELEQVHEGSAARESMWTRGPCRSPHLGAHRADKRCDLGSLAARPGWAKYGLPWGSVTRQIPREDPQARRAMSENGRYVIYAQPRPARRRRSLPRRTAWSYRRSASRPLTGGGTRE